MTMTHPCCTVGTTERIGLIQGSPTCTAPHLLRWRSAQPARSGPAAGPRRGRCPPCCRPASRPCRCARRGPSSRRWALQSALRAPPWLRGCAMAQPETHWPHALPHEPHHCTQIPVLVRRMYACTELNCPGTQGVTTTGCQRRPEMTKERTHGDLLQARFGAAHCLGWAPRAAHQESLGQGYQRLQPTRPQC